MDRTVAHLNIEYFRKLLAGEMAETKLQTSVDCWLRKKPNVEAARNKTSGLRRYLAPVGRAYIHSVAGFGF